MCGICGMVGGDVSSQQRGEIIARMSTALFHRGPDGDGFYSNDNLAMGMQRLSIIDIAGAYQPLRNEDESLVLMVNGEIYNYLELRVDLIARGHRFRSQGDCEVILHLYEEYGVDCLQYLRGMFAFALWDHNKRELFLARDRMGEKPLYLYEKDECLVFASELKALIGSKIVPFEIDHVAVDQFFHLQYVPEPRTIIQNVRKLDAAHYLVINTSKHTKREDCYWRMEDAPVLNGDPVELLREKLEEIGKLIIRADVPVGVALSGGWDSSLIAALASKHYGHELHAFTAGYPGQPACDERASAKELADRLGVRFHSVEISVEDVVDSFPKVNALRDDPIADISGHGYYHVSRAAKETGVPVMLQGQGGDELFWGYRQVRRMVSESLQKRAACEDLFGILQYLRPSMPQGTARWQLRKWAATCFGLNNQLKMYGKHKRENPDWLCFLNTNPSFRWIAERRGSLYGDAMRTVLDGGEKPEDMFCCKHPWPNVGVLITKYICDTYLRENGIVQGDRFAMANSVEMRLPLLDHKFVETVIGLRKGKSDLNKPPKWHLREIAKEYLPEHVLQRPKRGFEPPSRLWYEGLQDRYGELLRDGCLVQEGILNKQILESVLDDQLGNNLQFPLFFRSLVLEQWISFTKEML